MLMYLMFLLFERECGPRWVSSEDVAWPPWRPKPNHCLRPSPDSHTKGKRSPRAFIWVERGSTEPETSEMDCCSLYPTKSVWPETVWNLIRPTVMFSNIFFKCVHLSRHGINSLNLKKCCDRMGRCTHCGCQKEQRACSPGHKPDSVQWGHYMPMQNVWVKVNGMLASCMDENNCMHVWVTVRGCWRNVYVWVLKNPSTPCSPEQRPCKRKTQRC